jgi:hypothetical protein
VTERWQDRNRRDSNHRSHLALIPLEKLFSDRNDIILYREQSDSFMQQSSDPFEHVLDNPKVIISVPQQKTGSDNLQWKIPPSEWPTVLLRIEQ